MDLVEKPKFSNPHPFTTLVNSPINAMTNQTHGNWDSEYPLSAEQLLWFYTKVHLWNSCQVKLLYLSSIWLFLTVGSKIELPIQHKFLWGRNWKRHATVSSYLWWSDVIGSGQPEYISISPLIDYFAHCITEIWDTNSVWIKIGLTMSRLREKIKGLQFQDGLHIFT